MRGWRNLLAGVVLMIGTVLHGGAARAASAGAYCRQIGTDDALHGIPQSLVPAATRLFGLQKMPAEQIRHTTYFRCYDRHVLVCNTGANLPCGKANASRDLPGANGWCAQHPDSDFIPMYVTGHDTIYRWRCQGPKAIATGTVFGVDPRGFVKQMWKRADP